MDSSDNEKQNDSNQCEYTYPCVILCLNCEALLGDSFCVVADFPDINFLALRGVTRNVLVDEKLHLSKDTFDESCTYQLLICRKCSTQIGKKYISTNASLDSMRNLFLFDMDNLISYQLGDPDQKIVCDLKMISVQYLSLQLDKLCTVLKHLDFKIRKFEQSMPAENFKEVDSSEKIERLNISDLYREACSSQESELLPEQTDYGLGINDSGHESQHCQKISSKVDSVDLTEKTFRQETEHVPTVSPKRDHRVEAQPREDPFPLYALAKMARSDSESVSQESDHNPPPLYTMEEASGDLDSASQESDHNPTIKSKHNPKVNDRLASKSGSEYSLMVRSKRSPDVKKRGPKVKERLGLNSDSERSSTLRSKSSCKVNNQDLNSKTFNGNSVNSDSKQENRIYLRLKKKK